PDLPEALTAGRERVYLGWFYRTFGHRPEAISEHDIDEYVRTYSQLGAMRAGFAYYRALPQDIADNQASARAKLTIPVLAIGGANARGRGREPEESLRRLAANVEGEVFDDCGHFIPEEQPQRLAERLLRFFAASR